MSLGMALHGLRVKVGIRDWCFWLDQSVGRETVCGLENYVLGQAWWWVERQYVFAEVYGWVESKYLDQGYGSMSLVRPDLELKAYVWIRELCVWLRMYMCWVDVWNMDLCVWIGICMSWVNVWITNWCVRHTYGLIAIGWIWNDE
jgi:hypothetical protein